MAQLLTIRLNRHDAQPWGFRLQGGKDFGTPLVVQKVNGGSIAENAGLIPGDAVIQINNVEVFNLRHKDAQDIIVRSGNTFDVLIQRGGSTWRPQVTPVGSMPTHSNVANSIPTVTKTSLAHKPQEVRHIGSGYNSSARPFSSVNGGDGQVKSIVNKQYNTPVGIYSEEAIAETLSAQAEVLAGGVLGVNFKKNEKVYNSANSEVYKFLQEQDTDPSEPDPPAPSNFFWTASHAIGGRRSPGPKTPTSIASKEDDRIGTPLQQNTLAPGASHRPSLPAPKLLSQDDTTKAESSTPTAPKATSGETSGAGVPTCNNCGVSIVGVFVRVKDKNLHVDCFKCATCGTSLKNQGYYNFNNKLYCDIHAKLAAVNNPPPGTEGYYPVPIKPNTKLSANTISAALSAHHHQSNGTSHLVTSPTSNSDPGSIVTPSFQPSHSRTSSSSSSVGTINSCISSLSPNISSTPEKLSPVHSRQSSGSGTLVGGAGGPNLQQLKTAPVPPTTVCTMSSNETTINHKQNENDMNSNNRNTTNGTAGGGGHGAPQTNAYNQFLKEYSNKNSNETTDGGYKSLLGDTNGNGNTINMTYRGGASNGHHPEGSTTESLYGTIRHDTKIQPHEEFQYVTLDGSIIKSVIPPGKGIKTHYKVNQGYGGPKPFNTGPPMGGPKSPSSYPPISQAPNWAQPKPATNPYATLPRTTGSSQEEECLEQSYEYCKDEEHQYEDLEVAQATRTSSTVGSVIWPPPMDDNRLTPTATPLYIAPPETQHVKPKYIQKSENQQTEQQQLAQQEERHVTIEEQQKIYQQEGYQQQQQYEQQQQYNQQQQYEQQQHYQQQQQYEQQQQYQQQQQYERQQQYQQQQHQQLQWQSRSAPELTAVKQHIELESSSDSYTSTCTTTTTTSEEYQKMYQAQMQAYQQMQQMYEQSGSEIDYHMDMEVAAMQQQQEQSYSTSSEFLSFHSGRRSAQECAETISGPLSTYQLVGLVREVTPSPTPPAKGPRKVEFADDVDLKKEEKAKVESNLKKEESKIKSELKENEESTIREDELRIVKVEDDSQVQKIFQPTPEIKIEIPEQKPLPPSNIPNPVPKEWISPMVKALTTAPDKPVIMTDQCPTCPCKVPCDAKECKCKKTQENTERESNVKKDDEQKVEIQPEILSETPPKGSFIARVASTAPSDPIQFVPKSSEPISLPEETEPYMPPPIDMKPYEREDFRPKSPLLRALITAPDRTYSPLGTGVCSQLDDLPRPKEKLSMVDALTVASDRCYTPLNPENALSLSNKDEKKSSYELLFEQEQQQSEHSVQKASLDTHMDRQTSAFTSFSGPSSTNSFQPKTDPILPYTFKSSVDSSSISKTCQNTQHSSHTQQQQNLYQASASVQQQQSMYQASSSIQQQKQSMYQASSYQSMKQSQTHQSSSTSVHQTSCIKSECQKESQESNQKVSFPPPSVLAPKKAIMSGLHKPESIPQYQRNWTILPSQRPVKTPEPPELRENVPLAFVDVPREPSPNVEIPMAANKPASSKQSSVGAAVSNGTRSSETNQTTSTVPIIIEDRSGPITMTFQSLDDHPEDHSHAHPRPFTPSIINKAAPIVPFYQTADKLVFEECSARTSQTFDRRSASPCPERARSPAPGPPPNPLNAIRAPRIKEDDLVPMRCPQVQGSITTGQPYLGAQLMQQQQQQQQGQLLSHYETVSQSGAKSFIDKPEVVQQKQIGDMQIQTRAKESQLNEEQRSQLESKTTTQIGNTQIERRRKVVEEFEHTQKAKTVEIRKTADFTNIPVPPPLPPPLTSNGCVAQNGKESEHRKQLGRATEMLAQSLEKLNVNTQENFRFEAGKILSNMLEARLAGKNSPPSALKEIDPHPMKKIIEMTDSSLLPTKTDNFPVETLTNGNTSILKSPPNGKVPELEPLETVIFRNKTTNPNAKRELTSHALDRRSYIEKDQQSVQEDNNPKPTTNEVEPKQIANELEDGKHPICCHCKAAITRGPFITALGRIWCPEHFICVNANCRRPLQDIGFVEEKGDLYCEYCFEKFLAPTCSKCNNKIKGDCLNAIGKHFHPECFTCTYCGKLFGNSPFFLEEGEAYCEADWNELFTTKCFACGFPVEAGDRWVEALNHNYHSQCFNCTMCKKNLEGQSFYNKGGRPFCKNHAR